MTASMQLEVLTPDKQVLETTATAMRVLLPDGWWGVLPGHAPMIAYFDEGVVHYTSDENKRYIALYRGTIEVQQKLGQPTRVLILTSAAEEGEDLDEVQTALDEQAAKLAEVAKKANMEFNQLRLSLEKSLQKADISDIGLQ